jgi:hypothetical protein
VVDTNLKNRLRKERLRPGDNSLFEEESGIMLFENFGLSLVFGIFTTVATLACMYKLTVMWQPYEERKRVVVEDHGHH